MWFSKKNQFLKDEQSATSNWEKAISCLSLVENAIQENNDRMVFTWSSELAGYCACAVCSWFIPVVTQGRPPGIKAINNLKDLYEKQLWNDKSNPKAYPSSCSKDLPALFELTQKIVALFVTAIGPSYKNPNYPEMLLLVKLVREMTTLTWEILTSLGCKVTAPQPLSLPDSGLR